jgi:sirohydrochlorin cobaltochelatase
MTLSTDDKIALAIVESRIDAILPEIYQHCDEDVAPTAMGSTALRFGRDGRVAWNEMWTSFCDLAMAGGPPHKGVLLEPGAPTEIDTQPERYREVVTEICRGVQMVTGLAVHASPVRGWVRVACLTDGMAGWLLRAITMENVAVRADALAIDVPAAPHFRLDKEIKNVVTVVAKTTHYWLRHTSRAHQDAIGRLFVTLSGESALVEPATSADAVTPDRQLFAARRAAESIRDVTGLSASPSRYMGWLGIECPSVAAAIWMMRAVVVGNVLSRREGPVLFVAINAVQDPGGHRVSAAAIGAYRLACARGVFQM